MENMMASFSSKEFGQIRVIQENGKCLFCGLDVAKALGYKNNRKALTDHCRCVTKRYAPHPQSPNKTIEMAFIPEGDVYRLIVHSKLPTAVRFERWVFDEVLPTIRKHGGYLGESLLEQIERDPEILFRFADALVKERRENKALRKELLNLKPKAEFYDAFVNPGDCTNIRATAKELNVPERLFCKYLQHKKYLYRAPAGNLMPYAGPFRRGFFIVRDFYNRDTGFFGCYTLFTPAGKDELRRQLAEIEAWQR
ncbi:BRO family protein [Faecalibacterium sp. An121]|uniref:BRO family protein n=1 Tax=Faecalibacterium sp. An121 TaxID=1965550 RepID=UPI000B398F6C|nr:phage antirepressor KilAC domain-containing protein [Faecalibacterium sp. An121]OUQ39193.1 toxin Bro [Faecalibacterium sp. An121]